MKSIKLIKQIEKIQKEIGKKKTNSNMYRKYLKRLQKKTIELNYYLENRLSRKSLKFSKNLKNNNLLDLSKIKQTNCFKIIK